MSASIPAGSSVEPTKGNEWVKRTLECAGMEKKVHSRAKLTPPDLAIDEWKKIHNEVEQIEQDLASECFYAHLTRGALVSVITDLGLSTATLVIHWTALRILKCIRPMSPRAIKNASKIKNSAILISIVVSTLFWSHVARESNWEACSALKKQADEIRRLSRSKINDNLT